MLRALGGETSHIAHTHQPGCMSFLRTPPSRPDQLCFLFFRRPEALVLLRYFCKTIAERKTPRKCNWIYDSSASYTLQHINCVADYNYILFFGHISFVIYGLMPRISHFVLVLSPACAVIFQLKNMNCYYIPIFLIENLFSSDINLKNNNKTRRLAFCGRTGTWNELIIA